MPSGLRYVRPGRKSRNRWTVASACAWLAEVYYREQQHDRARHFMRESNAIASNGEVQYSDILFVNAYYLWKVATDEGNTSESRIAIGRMKYLRPHLEQDLAEVRDFDRFIEKGGAA